MLYLYQVFCMHTGILDIWLTNFSLYENLSVFFLSQHSASGFDADSSNMLVVVSNHLQGLWFTHSVLPCWSIVFLHLPVINDLPFKYWEMIILCLKCKKHLSGMGCRVAYVDLEAYTRLSENWYYILCFPYHSYIHYNQYVLLTSCKVVKIGQLCRVMQVCVCVSNKLQAWKFPSTFSNIFLHVVYKFSFQGWVKICSILTNILYLSKCNTGFFQKILFLNMWGYPNFAYRTPNWTVLIQTKACIAKRTGHIGALWVLICEW